MSSDTRARATAMRQKAQELRAKAPTTVTAVQAELLRLAQQYEDLAAQLDRLADNKDKIRGLPVDPKHGSHT